MNSFLGMEITSQNGGCRFGNPGAGKFRIITEHKFVDRETEPPYNPRPQAW